MGIQIPELSLGESFCVSSLFHFGDTRPVGGWVAPVTPEETRWLGTVPWSHQLPLTPAG